MVSVEVGGPQESSDGRAAMISVSDIGAMTATCSGGENTWGLRVSPTRFEIFRCVESLVGQNPRQLEPCLNFSITGPRDCPQIY